MTILVLFVIAFESDEFHGATDRFVSRLPPTFALSMTADVSVITVSYNAFDEIDRTLDSVRDLTIRNRVEYIVIDGGSRDGTAERLRFRAAEIDRLIIEPDHGIYDAMNKGIAMATGRYVGLINAGDEYLAEGFGRLAHEAIRTQCEMVSGNMLFRHPHTGQLARKRYADTSIRRRDCFTNQSCSLVRRDVYKTHGRFDTAFDVVADVDFFLRVRPHIDLHLVEADVSKFDIGGCSSSCTFSRLPRFLDELNRLYRRHRMPRRWKRLLINGVKFSGMALVASLWGTRRMHDQIMRRYLRHPDVDAVASAA